MYVNILPGWAYGRAGPGWQSMQVQSQNHFSMKTILVVEDEPVMREELARIFEFEGYGVLTACDGEDALVQLRTIRPSLILCDLGMPKLDGYGVLAWVREHQELSQTPFLVLTAFRHDGSQRRAEELGCDGYITKPFDIDQLLGEVARHVNL